MKFVIASQLDYEVISPLTFLLSVRAQQGPGQEILWERFSVSLNVPHQLQECSATGTRFDRVFAEIPGLYTVRYEAEVERVSERLPAGVLPVQGPETFGPEVLPYLYPSRYCQSDRIGNLSYDLFGDIRTPEEQVRAVTDWIASRINYVSGSTNNQTSAVDTVVERAGVCRDFAHLGIALCRSLNIPARYFTGYAHDLQPPDFHACFEAWVGGRWTLQDATRLASPDGVVRIGTGRDASDCSVCTAFGSMRLLNQSVECHAADPGFQKMTPEELAAFSVSLEPPPNL
ncbi:MAG: transglutaminase family protein [Verrucomicrobiaceae bacterium]|nr:MAG: transglutaminase family protein [Verrucomicrobiaceae bacterium]